MKTLCIAFASLLVSGFVIHAAAYFPPPDSAGGWRTCQKAEGRGQKSEVEAVRELAGMDLPRLEQA